MSFTIDDPRNWLTFLPRTLAASPFYSKLWEHLQDDEEMLSLVNLVQKDQPNLITFFTAVNFLVLRDPLQPLARYYPYLYPDDAPSLAEAYPVFRAYVQAHREELEYLLPPARLQTNEVTRCAHLLPAFALAYRRGGYRPLNMLEIGSSAGLHLLWNQYCYHYESGLTTEDMLVGNPGSPVHIQCTLLGPYLPPLPEGSLPVVAQCQGIELVPRDITNEEDMAWVRAAIWPEERERYQVLDAAIRFARGRGVRLHTGDAADLLPAFLAAIPPQHTAVVWSSFAINQGPLDVKKRLEEQLAAGSQQQTIYAVSLEFALEQEAGPRLELREYHKGTLIRQELLARCSLHGEQMTWLGQEDMG